MERLRGIVADILSLTRDVPETVLEMPNGEESIEKLVEAVTEVRELGTKESVIENVVPRSLHKHISTKKGKRRRNDIIWD